MSDLFLNELSTRSPAATIEEGRTRMKHLVTTIQRAVDAGATRRLRMAEPVDAVSLAPGYKFVDWRSDAAVDIDLRRYWRSRIVEHFPVAAADDKAALVEKNDLSEFKHKGQPAVALGAAYLFDGLGLSVSSDPKWEAPHLKLEWSSLDGDALATREVEVRNACEPAHVSRHADWLRPPRGMPQTLAEVWSRKAELFPSLEFCPEVEQQFVTAQAMHLFMPVYRRLQQLNALFATWSSGPLPMKPQMPGEPRPESESTLNQFSRERTFVCADGTPRVFSWHVSLTKGDRLQFFPDEARRLCIIGYVGAHLPITSGS